ncbi:MAG: dipeptidase E [Oceanicoccus sp.]|jgi:dipeptidase E
MKLYLSSYKLGNETETLQRWLAQTKKRVGYVPNALDFTFADPEKVKFHRDLAFEGLKGLGFTPELLDFKEYFGKKAELKEKLDQLDMLWVSGGNTFVLRQAMYLSGFDELIQDLSERDDFVYGAFSAGACILSPSLKGLDIVDEPNDFPYTDCVETIWDGLGIIDYAFLPHYDSDHPESADIDKEIQYCVENNIPYKPLRDGEVILVE